VGGDTHGEAYEHIVIRSGIQNTEVTLQSAILVPGRATVVRKRVHDKPIHGNADSCSGKAVVDGTVVIADVARHSGSTGPIAKLRSNLITQPLPEIGGQVGVSRTGIQQDGNGKIIRGESGLLAVMVREADRGECDHERRRLGGAGLFVDRDSRELALKLCSIDTTEQDLASLGICHDGQKQPATCRWSTPYRDR